MLFWSFRIYRIFLLLHTLYLLFLHFLISCVVCSPKFDEMSVRLNSFGCHLPLIIFVVSHMIFFLFYHWFKVVQNSLLFQWTILACFRCMSRRMLRVVHCYDFCGVRSSNNISLLNGIPYLLELLDIPSCGVLHVIPLDNRVVVTMVHFNVSDHGAYSMRRL